jgi:hypothetical protein
MKIQIPLRHCLQELLHHESSWTEDAELELETLYAKLNEAIDGLPVLKGIIDKRRREIAVDKENRKKAGFKIDPETADVTFNWGDICDPYGHSPGTAECIGRNYFARSPDGDEWVEFGDLPEPTRDRLWARIRAGDFDKADDFLLADL